MIRLSELGPSDNFPDNLTCFKANTLSRCRDDTICRTPSSANYMLIVHIVAPCYLWGGTD